MLLIALPSPSNRLKRLEDEEDERNNKKNYQKILHEQLRRKINNSLEDEEEKVLIRLFRFSIAGSERRRRRRSSGFAAMCEEPEWDSFNFHLFLLFMAPKHHHSRRLRKKRRRRKIVANPKLQPCLEFLTTTLDCVALCLAYNIIRKHALYKKFSNETETERKINKPVLSSPKSRFSVFNFFRV